MKLLSGAPNWYRNDSEVLPWGPKNPLGNDERANQELRGESSNYSRELLENLGGGLGTLWSSGTPSPPPPQYCFLSFLSLRFLLLRFVRPPHTPDLGVGGLTGLRPLPPTPKVVR